MRSDLYIEGVLRKCQVLKHAGLWAAEPKDSADCLVAQFYQQWKNQSLLFC